MSAEFLAAVLEGFEDTLDEVLCRDLPENLRAIAETLKQHICEQRESVERLATAILQSGKPPGCITTQGAMSK